MMNTSMIEVVFKVYADVAYGEEIFLSGNVPALGCNDISRAIPLVTSTNDFPWWRTKEGIFLSGETGIVKYRYCIFSGGKFNRWEGGFRTLDVSDDRSLVKATEDKFGAYSNGDSFSEKSPKKAAMTVSKDDHSFRAKLYAAWNRSKSIDSNLESSDSVVIVSYFLPVILSRKNDGKWSAAWDREALLSSLHLTVSRVIWVGSVRYGNLPIPADEEEAVTAVLAELNCVPVFINQTMHNKFYEGFCKKSLWLALHHVADVYGPLQQSDKSLKVEQDLWFNYSTVHKFFREKVLEVFQPGYLIWIHGLHLMLLPNFLRRRLPQAKIGYFFHTPFPSSEIWRTMARREDLLRGILGADQIGFHLFEYARHFLTTCHRLLGYNSEMNASGMMSVNVDGRQVSITCIHVGVDMPRMQEVFDSESFKLQVVAWKERFQGKVVVSGIDRLERLKGIPLRLMAIDKFLESNPSCIGLVTFSLIGISAGERAQDYKQTVHDVRILVERINEKYSTLDKRGVIYFEERPEKEIKLAERLAYFAVSDILLMTATRDGLNRYPMEFTLARKEHGKLLKQGVIKCNKLEGSGEADQGLVIISEFVSSARVMRGALVVNPWRVDEVVSALNQALHMNDGERAERSRRNMEFSARLTCSNWAKYVLNDLKAAQGSSDPNANYAVGFGLQYKVMNLKAGFHALDIKDVAKAYRVARHRLILLDWGGTLVPNVDKHDKLHAFALATGHATQEGPSVELTLILEALCSDPKNFIFVVSGKEIRAVSKFFGNIRGLGLGAEHGFYYKWPRDDIAWDLADVAQQKSKWQTIMHIADDSWKESAKIVMDIFVQRTHGTYIEQKGNALIWQFSDADPEFGFLQSKELEDHLHSILSTHPVEIIRGGGVADGYIEVRPAGASKGLFLEHVLGILKTQNIEPDFIMAVGDDSSDEPMFERVGLLVQDQPQINAFSVTVGKKPTAAKAYVDDSHAVLELLNTLVKSLQRDKKYFSVTDLPSQVMHDLSGFANEIKREASERSNFPRATSDGKLAISGPNEILQRKGFNERPEYSRSDSQSIHPIASLSLSMKDYMSSLSDDHHDDEMGGISF